MSGNGAGTKKKEELAIKGEEFVSMDELWKERLAKPVGEIIEVINQLIVGPDLEKRHLSTEGARSSTIRAVIYTIMLLTEGVQGFTKEGILLNVAFSLDRIGDKVLRQRIEAAKKPDYIG